MVAKKSLSVLGVIVAFIAVKNSTATDAKETRGVQRGSPSASNYSGANISQRRRQEE